MTTEYQGPLKIPNESYHGRRIGDVLVLTNTQYTFRKDVAEINVTNECNWKCINCQSVCGLAPNKERVTIKAVENFVEETQRLKHRWLQIKLTGGEPLLHPEIFKITELLSQLSTNIILNTNGSQKSKLEDIKNRFKLQVVSSETKSAGTFESMNLAPIDLPEYKNVDENVYKYGCPRTQKQHGITLGADNKYYPCPTLYHVDRVFDLKLGIESLAELINMSEEEIRDKFFKKACRYCGFFKYPRDMVAHQIISPSWEEAIKRYNQRKISFL